MVLHVVLSFFALAFPFLCTTSPTTPPIPPQSLRLRGGGTDTTETLYDVSRFFGGRVGNPQCDINLGSPHRSACRGALRAMEWQRMILVNKGVTTYMTPTRMAPFQMEVQLAPESQTPKPSNPTPVPFKWPRLALPRLYSCEDCAISLDFVDDNDDMSDLADVNAVRQTALAIMNSCVKPAPGAPARVHRTDFDRASGGWQLAGLNQKILVSLHGIPYEYPKGKRPGISQTHGTCSEPSTKDPTYMSRVNERRNNDQDGSGQGNSGQGSGHFEGPGHFGISDWSDFWEEYWEEGPSQGCGGSNHNSCCGSGLGYLIAAGTREDRSIWDVLLGVTWDVMKTLGNVGVCVAVQIDDGFSA